LNLFFELQPLESIDTIFQSPDKNKIGTGLDVLDRRAASDNSSDEKLSTSEVERGSKTQIDAMEEKK
jgi:hypothetical protein